MVLVKAKVVDSTHIGSIGRIAGERHSRLLRNLGNYLMANVMEAPGNSMNADK